MGNPTALNHDVRVVNGATIYLPSDIQDGGLVNLAIPNVYAEDAVQKYPIGTKLVLDDMVFRYCHAEADPGGTSSTIRANRAVVFKQIPVTASVVVAADVGDRTITATVAGVAVNNYENGYIIQQPTVSWDQNSKLRIKSNTTTVFTLKDALVEAVAATDTMLFSKNMYSDVGKIPTNGTGKEYMSWVAVPLLHITPSCYFWGLTWGPCCIQYGDGSTDRPGETASVRAFGFNFYGAAICSAGALNAPSQQIGGFVIPNTWGTWSMLVMLQLSP